MKTIYTETAPKPIGPYSQGKIASGFIFLSGQIGIDPKSGNLVDGLAAQVEMALSNIENILKSQGLGLSNVVKTTVYLTSMNLFSEFNTIYAQKFKGENLPARTTVAVAELPKNALVEIEVIAHQ
ncbi:MAG: RidA family protein [Candidatus Kryptoniota bacterium]